MPTPSDAYPRATMSQVAALAGVSLKTASRVINDEPNVSRSTAERVRTAARQLGFRPNALARDFRIGARSRSVGLIIGDVANPFYSRITRGAERVLRDAGLRIVAASSDEDPDRERELVDEMLEHRVSGIMLVTSASNHDYVDRERQLGTPFVFLDRAPEDIVADSIVIDNSGGMTAAVEHLRQAGHKRIALLGDLSRLSTHRERLKAYTATMIAGSLDAVSYVRSDCHDIAAAEAATADLLSAAEPPTAIIATNNRLTIGALRALRPVDVPVALVGFDDFDLADVLEVSVIAHDPELMGASAAEYVLARIAGDTAPARQLVLPAHLIERRSSSPATSRSLL